MRTFLIVVLSLFVVACSDYQRARSAYEGGNYQKAFELFKKLSESGDVRAEYDLSLMYLQGIGTKQDVGQGWFWMIKSADHGNTMAMVELGGRYEYGVNLDKDETQAVFWYKKAALAGSSVGHYNLAKMYIDGRGVQIDPARGYAWMVLSAQKGNPIAKAEADAYRAKLSPELQARCDQMVKQLEAENLILKNHKN
jgi:TPR repeat protein